MPAASARSRGQANRFAHKQSRVRPQNRRKQKHQKRKEAAHEAISTARTITPDTRPEVQDTSASLAPNLSLPVDNAKDQCTDLTPENMSFQLEKPNKLLDDREYRSSLDDYTRLRHRYTVADMLEHPLMDRSLLFEMLFLYKYGEDDDYRYYRLSRSFQLPPVLMTLLEMFKRKWINTADYAKKIAQLSCHSTRLAARILGDIDELTETLSYYIRRMRDQDAVIYEVRPWRNLEIKVFTDAAITLLDFAYCRSKGKVVRKHRALLVEYEKWLNAFIHAWADDFCWTDPYLEGSETESDSESPDEDGEDE